MVTNFEITVLKVLNCKKLYPEMANYLPHFAEAYRRHKLVADQNVLLNTITNSHNFNFTNIVLPSQNHVVFLLVT